MLAYKFNSCLIYAGRFKLFSHNSANMLTSSQQLDCFQSMYFVNELNVGLESTWNQCLFF